MSWDAYVQQIQACSADIGGGIFSREDGSPWCQYGPADMKATVKNIVECCKSRDPCKAPIMVNGEKLMVVRAEEDELVAKKGSNKALVAKLAKSCVVVGVGGEGKDARTINVGICKLGDYLRDSGY